MASTDVRIAIPEIYARRKAAVYALCLSYSARALNRFREFQHEELFWHNQTGQAYARVFSAAREEEDVVSWFMAHAVQYGIYLELCNNRQNAALKPVIDSLMPQFANDLRAIYGLGVFQL